MTLFLVLLAIAVLTRALWKLGDKMPYHELMRFPGNEKALSNYEARRDAMGYGARVKN